MSQIQRKADRSMRRRIWFITITFCVVCFSAVLIRLVYLQIIHQDFYEQKALNNQTRDVTIYPTRGTIYDRNGKPLAISASTEMLILNPRKVPDEETGSLISETLSQLLGLDAATVLEKTKKDTAYVVLLRGVEKDQADPVRAFVTEKKLTAALYFEDDSTRYYPYGSFLSHVLGFVGSDEQGLAGLEIQYDDVLTGTPGRSVTLADANGNALSEDYEMYYEAQEGKSLVLTIDEVLQHYLEKNLEIAYYDNKVRGSATGIVMDVNTGGVLAMASYPDFDPNEPFTLANEEKVNEIAAITDEAEQAAAKKTALYQQWNNPAVSFTYYPGSTFKIVTASAALEEGVVNMNTTFYCPGYKNVDGYPRPIHCWKRIGHGSETFPQAIQNSCNPAFMTIGLSLGATKFEQYVKAFGLREKTGIDLPGEAVGQFNLTSNVDLAVYSFGQNFTLTPLQLVTAVSTVANGGTLLKPHVVKEILNNDGSVAENTDKQVVRQVISKDTSKTMCDLLESVVTVGTGKNAYVAGYRVAGKTGTTEKIADQNQQGVDGLYVTSFVAFAPADNPQIAVLILLDEPTAGTISGGINVAPVIRRFMEEALPYLDVDPIYTDDEQSEKDVIMPPVTGMSLSEAEAALKKVGLTCVGSGTGEKVMDQVPAAGATVSRSTKAIVYLSGTKPETMVTVPDLTGSTLNTAKQKLTNLGLFVRISGGVSEGSQIVTKQDVTATSQVAYGSVITVETSDPSQRAQ